MSLLGLDVGTTGCKAVAFDEDGKELAKAYREHPFVHPRPGWVEIEPLLIWNNVKDVLREVNAVLDKDPVKALAISCLGETVVPIDRNGKELCNFIVTFDSRTQEQCQWWEKNAGARKVFAITGMPLHPMYTINKIMWVKEHERGIFEKTWKFLCMQDYVAYKLSGACAVDHSLASRTMAFEIVKREWSREMLSWAGLDVSLLPDVYPSGKAVASVSRSIAGDVGFPRDVVVATGGHDQPCGALGAGVVESGMAMNATGTSDVICPALAKPLLTDKMLEFSFACYPHTREDYYFALGVNLTGGLLLRWYRDALCHEEKELAARQGRDPYEVILESMREAPSDVFILPHFVGSGTPYFDHRSRGAILGLTLETRKPDLARAAVDSINYELKLNIDCMEEAGIEIRELRAIGGGAKSEQWLQMKADVFGKPVVSMSVSEAASLGAAILAGKSVGLFGSTTEGARQLVRAKKIYEPDEAKNRIYQEKFQKYRQIYPLLREFNHASAA